MMARPCTITPSNRTRRRTRSRTEEDGLQNPLEENAIEENRTFTPADLLLFQNGDGTRRPPPARRFRKACARPQRSLRPSRNTPNPWMRMRTPRPAIRFSSSTGSTSCRARSPADPQHLADRELDHPAGARRQTVARYERWSELRARFPNRLESLEKENTMHHKDDRQIPRAVQNLLDILEQKDCEIRHGRQNTRAHRRFAGELNHVIGRRSFERLRALDSARKRGQGRATLLGSRAAKKSTRILS